VRAATTLFVARNTKNFVIPSGRSESIDPRLLLGKQTLAGNKRFLHLNFCNDSRRKSSDR
jgi:hypothetical protein